MESFYTDNIKREIISVNMVSILDTTLREGSQTPNVKFTKIQKIKIAKLLDDFGVDIIEVGHPVISDYDKECVKAVANLKLKAETLAHARVMKEDIDAVIDCGTDWIKFFCGVNEFSLKYKLHKTKKEVAEMIIQSVKYAKKNNLKVIYSIEDATRTSLKDIIQIAKLVKKAGADVINLPDTTGIAKPEEYYNLILKVIKLADVTAEAHCHNDFGFALANAIAAYRAGAKIIDVTVNGIGERSGITSLVELCLVMKLHYKQKNNWKLEKLTRISDVLVKFSGIKLDKLRPIIGENAFTHTAALHQKAAKKNPECYESINPTVVGRKRKFS